MSLRETVPILALFAISLTSSYHFTLTTVVRRWSGARDGCIGKGYRLLELCDPDVAQEFWQWTPGKKGYVSPRQEYTKMLLRIASMLA